MTKVAITIEFDDDGLDRVDDERLAALWHVAQSNPAPHGDHQAGQVVERVGREIIRRWLARTTPPLWHHQGRDYALAQLRDLAKYTPPADAEPGSPDWSAGVWTPTAGPEVRTPTEEPT